jgi:hypothetical protein
MRILDWLVLAGPQDFLDVLLLVDSELLVLLEHLAAGREADEQPI